jgi:hypothetical protein
MLSAGLCQYGIGRALTLQHHHLKLQLVDLLLQFQVLGTKQADLIQ